MHSLRVNVFNVMYVTGIVFSLLGSVNIHAKDVIGWVENVHVTSKKIKIEAKVDTGADSASLHCEYLTPYRRGIKKWVKFSVVDIDGRSFLFDKKVERIVKVKRHIGNGQRRYLVRMGICIGSHYKVTDVSLTDRSGFEYGMLIGRKYLKEYFIVDPSLKYTVTPQCK